MNIVTKQIDSIISSVLNMDTQQVIRLVIIVGGYILFRQIASRHLIKKQLESKVRQDEERIQKDKKERLIQDPADQKEGSSASGFGWGKKTRQRVQKQQNMFANAVEELKRQQELAGGDSDEDIQDLLED